MQNFRRQRARYTLRTALIAFALLALAACGENMGRDSRIYPYEPNTFFSDNRSNRPLVEGVVPRGHLEEDEHFYNGEVNGEAADTFPFEVTDEVIKRGRERYNIFCAPCHAADGYGRGMIVQRGFPPPPSLHEQRLLEAPVGHFFNVITNGIGVMYPYGYRVPPQDRWAIIAYIRTLQYSQNANVDELSPQDRQKLQEGQK